MVQQAVHHDHGRPRRLAHIPVEHSQRPAPAGPAGAEAKSAKAAKMATMVIVYGAWLLVCCGARLPFGPPARALSAPRFEFRALSAPRSFESALFRNRAVSDPRSFGRGLFLHCRNRVLPAVLGRAWQLDFLALLRSALAAKLRHHLACTGKE